MHCASPSQPHLHLSNKKCLVRSLVRAPPPTAKVTTCCIPLAKVERGAPCERLVCCVRCSCGNTKDMPDPARPSGRSAATSNTHQQMRGNTLDGAGAHALDSAAAGGGGGAAVGSSQSRRQQQAHKATQHEQLKLLQSRLVQDFSGAGHEEDSAFMSTVVSSVSTVLDGESVISTPAASRVPWLGTISVTPGQVKGSVVKPFRTYVVESQVLASDHVLPWKISAVWRYSQLRSLLVDRLRSELFAHGLEEDFEGFVDTFPRKSWSGRLNEATAEARARDIQTFIGRGLELVSELMETLNVTGHGDNDSGAAAGADDDEEGEDYNADQGEDEDEELYRIRRRRRRPKGLRVVLDLFTRDLLHLRPTIYSQISELSAKLGVIIASAPKDHCLLDKDFYVSPQQGL